MKIKCIKFGGWVAKSEDFPVAAQGHSASAAASALQAALLEFLQ